MAVREREPDLLLLDVMMPGLSGLDACRTVKNNPVHGAHSGADAHRGRGH